MPIDHRKLITAGTRLARTAGVLYLLIVAVGGIAQLAVRAGLRVPGFASTTAQSSAGDPSLTPVSVGADLAIATVLALVGAATYLLLPPAGVTA